MPPRAAPGARRCPRAERVGATATRCPGPSAVHPAQDRRSGRRRRRPATRPARQACGFRAAPEALGSSPAPSPRRAARRGAAPKAEPERLAPRPRGPSRSRCAPRLPAPLSAAGVHFVAAWPEPPRRRSGGWGLSPGEPARRSRSAHAPALPRRHRRRAAAARRRRRTPRRRNVTPRRRRFPPGG